jgi:predicted RecB family endonuclease
MKKFNALGYRFIISTQNYKITGPNGTLAEVDILLRNGDFSLAVEVKAKLEEKDIESHIKRMEVLQAHADSNTERFLGAVAGVIVKEAVRLYAQRAGFYVIEPSGDTVKIDVPEGFKPREW